MEGSKLDGYLSRGEGLSLEFKRCGNQPGADTFETICSFANRQGGSILLGVLDDGAVEGIDARAVSAIERNIVNVVNNPDLFNVPPAIEFERITFGGGLIVLRIWVPMGPMVFRFRGTVYDRAADADIRVKSDAQINALYLRKQNYYTERRVYPWVTEQDLRLDLIPRVKSMILVNRMNHPWLSLEVDELFRSSRLYSRDPETGKEGFTVAAIMLFGKDDLILDVSPAYRTDAVLRRESVDRYDDRLVVKTNLLEAYDLLVGFCEKWLPDSFALEGMQRVSARDVIVRELVSNALIHRKFISPYIAKLVIDEEGIRTKNASRSLYSGPLTPDNLDPTPKNPIIANFFSQIGRAEELGSGTRNIFKYSRLYSGQDPELEDGDFFKAFVPVPGASGRPRNAAGYESGTESVVMAMLAERDSVTASEVARFTNASARTVRRRLGAMVEKGVLVTTAGGRSTSYRLP